MVIDINVSGDTAEISNGNCEMWFEDAKTDTERLFAKSIAATVVQHVATVNQMTKALFAKPTEEAVVLKQSDDVVNEGTVTNG